MPRMARAVRTECRDVGGVRKPKQERAVPLAPTAPQGSRGVPRARPCRLRPCTAAASRPPKGRRREVSDGRAPPAPQPKKEKPTMRIGDAELDLFRREVSCAALLECWPAGWRLVP